MQGESPAEERGRVEIAKNNTQDEGAKNAANLSRGPSGKRGEIKDRIFNAGREAFLSRGYDQVTLRQIARDAHCDPAMIPYYFGSKQQLFRECLNLPVDPAQQILELILEDPATAGERIAQYAFSMYEENPTAETMLALMRALMTDVATSERFRNYFREDVLGKVTQTLGADPSAEELIELTMAQMYGIVAMRYVVRLEPIASIPKERLIAHLAPTIQEGLDALIFASRTKGSTQP